MVEWWDGEMVKGGMVEWWNGEIEEWWNDRTAEKTQILIDGIAE